MPSYDWQRALVLLTYTMIGVVVIGAMYWAQAVIIPFALAMLFTLVLTPLVSAVQRAHLGARRPSFWSSRWPAGPSPV